MGQRRKGETGKWGKELVASVSFAMWLGYVSRGNDNGTRIVRRGPSEGKEDWIPAFRQAQDRLSPIRERRFARE